MVDFNMLILGLFILVITVLSAQDTEDDLKILKDLIIKQQNRIANLEEKFLKQEKNLQDALNIIGKCQLKDTTHEQEANSHILNVPTLTHNVKDRRQISVGRNVAFSTRLTKRVSGLGQYQAIMFDHVLTNDGNGYRTSDGIFAVPTSGMYVFTWTISTTGGQQETSELVKDGIAYAYSYADSIRTSSDADYGTSTNTVVIRANQGQHIWIRTGSLGDGVLDGNNLDMFSGWLLYETN